MFLRVLYLILLAHFGKALPQASCSKKTVSSTPEIEQRATEIDKMKRDFMTSRLIS
jgi:hypothetical protein